MKNIQLIIIAICFLIGCQGVSDNLAADYDELVSLFNEFREYQKPVLVDGIPDYSEGTMKAKLEGVRAFQQRLEDMDTTEWSTSSQVDYYLVWAEMNAVEYHHRVLEPWKHDPGFYSFFGGGDAGASMNLEGIMPALFDLEQPLNQAQQDQLGAAMTIVPRVLTHARSNLTEGSGDLAAFAIRNIDREAEFFNEMSEEFFEDNEKLKKLTKEAATSMRVYRQWIIDNKDKMTALAGSGKENYSWWNKRVQLSPWGWEESNFIIQREYDRVITWLKLEEQRNRNRPPLEVAMSERAYNKSLREALHYAVEFLKENEIMTIHDWVNPADYYLGGRGSEQDLSELSDEPSEAFYPENSNVDLKYRQREILPGENHEYVGHMLDMQRQERLNLSPIRKAERRFNMGSMRLEGWAVWMEEGLMQAGVLDERPQKGREMEYLMNASHMSLSVPDMKMHANEINLAEARKLCAEIMPRGWTKEDEGVVYFEMQSNLRNPGGFHSNVVTGKAYFMKLFRDYAVMKGEDFIIKEFIDKFLSFGVIPMPLIRWEMLGDDTEIRAITRSSSEIKIQ